MRSARSGPRSPLHLLATTVATASLVAGCAAGATPPPEAAIACVVDPSVVKVSTTSAYELGNGMNGTGVVIGKTGEVLTNNHVVLGAASVDVTVADGKRHTATVLGTDIANDLAVLRLADADGLPPARLGDSADVDVGERVYAIGNAGGNCRTPKLTSGSVEVLGASTVVQHLLNGDSLQLDGLIQTSTPLEHGVSGGPLVNADGEVIGILAAGYRESASDYDGFAIPINRARAVAAQVLSGRSSAAVHVGPPASLGVQAASSLRLPAGTGAGSVVVAAVLPGSPADRIGIEPGCHIESLDGQPIGSAREFLDFLHAHHPGDPVDVSWFDHRTASPHTERVTLVTGPPQ